MDETHPQGQDGSDSDGECDAMMDLPSDDDGVIRQCLLLPLLLVLLLPLSVSSVLPKQI